HETGIPFNDASGERLRDWMGIDRDTFYDPRKIAIVPMGFCFPGSGRSGDLPPRPECAPAWHPRLLPLLSDIRLTLAIGQYAQIGMLGASRGRSLTATVEAWRDYLAKGYLPLPHPSPRNQGWFKHHPWFTSEVIPALREQVRSALHK
ncbi:MAG: uracil-DNA glycosylase family protein, partial [Xanthomonadales bacterium]|nr:uracil-DNA glycosylase family protein [Xanthomonadales bacterium]